MKNISVLGSTGSIGVQTLDVCRRNSKVFSVCGLAAGSNENVLEQQIRLFKPKKAAIYDKEKYLKLKTSVSDTFTDVLCGEEGVCEVAAMSETDIVVSAIVGIAGLKPTLSAIYENKTIALANKETLVAAGKFVTDEAKKRNLLILPVDSEHSAIFQCLASNSDKKQVERIILTASGGPFFGKKRDELRKVSVDDALKHPNWVMGKKITVDSATLMNKGLEFIEAAWLFDMPSEKIDIVIQRQSIIHSMVEYKDGAILAQMGNADMRVPISAALFYPEREINTSCSRFDFVKNSKITFDIPDEKTFKCLSLAKRAFSEGGTATAFLNGANEAAVELFLDKKIGFNDIGDIIETALNGHNNIINYNISDVFEADKRAREAVYGIYGGMKTC